MIRILMALTMFTSLNAAAQMADASKAGPNNVSAQLSFGWPSAIFGLNYEHLIKDSMGVGAQFKMFPKHTGTKNPANQYMIIGATAGHHFYKKDWDLSFTPSINIVNIDPVATTAKSVTTIAPGLSIGLLCQITPSFAAGFDYSRYVVWFDSDYAGTNISDLAIKGRFSF